MTPGVARIVTWLVAITTVLATLSLGQWQLRRADEKQAAQALLTQRQQEPAWTASDWPCEAEAAGALPWQRPVRLTGHWLAERTVWLDNRPLGGQTGFEVITPLRLQAPGHPCHGRLVLVQRGWVPRNQQDRLHLPALPTPTGEVTVPGRLVAAPSRVYQLGEERVPQAGQAGPLIRQNVDAAFWRAWLGQSPLPGAVLQMQAETMHEPTPLNRQWPAPDLGRDKHLAYAAQWFALSALAAGLTLWFQIVRPRRSARLDYRARHEQS